MKIGIVGAGTMGSGMAQAFAGKSGTGFFNCNS